MACVIARLAFPLKFFFYIFLLLCDITEGLNIINRIYIYYIYIYTKNWQNQEINFNNIYNNIYAHKNYINRIYIYIYIYILYITIGMQKYSVIGQ